VIQRPDPATSRIRNGLQYDGGDLVAGSLLLDLHPVRCRVHPSAGRQGGAGRTHDEPDHERG
jgi:hypothetical protein